MTALERGKHHLLALRDELAELSNRPMLQSVWPTDPAFVSWWARTRLALPRALGRDHPITVEVLGVDWHAPPTVAGRAMPQHFGISTFTAKKVVGLLDAAARDLEWLSGDAGAFGASGIDPELWSFIATDVHAEQWGKAISQTALFTEDRIRRWTGQSHDVVGERLMTVVFGDEGAYQLGDTKGERQGWHRLAMGVAMALRNPAAHRIVNRPDHRLFALGVIGACSLLLTQLRFEHADDFVDRSPARPQPGSAEDD